MPTASDQLKIEYQAAPEKQMLTDSEYSRISQLEADEVLALPDSERLAYLATAKFKFGQRQKIDSIEGIVIGQKTAQEIADERRKKSGG